MQLGHKFLYLSLLFITSSAIGATDIDAILSCSSINNNERRLACFDQVSNSLLPPEKQIPTTSDEPKSVDVEKSIEASQQNGETNIVFASKVSEHSDLTALYDLDRNNTSGYLSIREHNPILLVPFSYNYKPNYNPYSPSLGYGYLDNQKAKNSEIKFQISFKTKLVENLFKTRSDLWFGYTQLSHWQAYDHSSSAPFRNTDYLPELFITQPVTLNLPGNGKLRMLGAGIAHNSNGRREPLSRSWNYAYIMAGMEWGKLTVVPTLWARIPEKKDDNNPDIMHYMGYGELKMQYIWDNQHKMSTRLRYNFKHNKGSALVNYTIPISGKLRAYFYLFEGYGMNLTDYNHRNRSLGIGLMFNGWD